MRFSRISLPYGAGQVMKSLLAVMFARKHPHKSLLAALQALFPARRITLHQQGRYALSNLLASLRRPGRAVLVPAFGCAIVPITVREAGYRPVLVDTAKNRPTMAPEALADALRTVPDPAAIILVHELGQPCDPALLDVIAAHEAAWPGMEIAVIEDLAIALGGNDPGRQPLGLRGDAFILSGGMGKPWSAWAFGAAGLALTPRAERLFHPVQPGTEPTSSLRSALMTGALSILQWFMFRPMRDVLLARASSDRDIHYDPDRMKILPSAFDCALLQDQLSSLPQNLEARRDTARQLYHMLHDHGLVPIFTPDMDGVPARVAFLAETRQARTCLTAELQAAGIDTTRPGRTALDKLEGITLAANKLVNAPALVERALCVTLPQSPRLQNALIRKMADVLRDRAN